MAEIKFDSRSIEGELQHVSNVKAINQCNPVGFKLQQPKDNTIPVVPVSVNKMFKYVPAGDVEEGTFSAAKFPGLFTAGVTGSSASIFIVLPGEEEKPARYFFFHASNADDVRNNAALQNFLKGEANAQIVIMVNGDSSGEDKILEQYLTTVHQMSGNDAIKMPGVGAGKIPGVDADKIVGIDGGEMPGSDGPKDEGDITGKMLGDDVSKMFGDAGKLLSDDVSEMLGHADNLLGDARKKSGNEDTVGSNVFGWSARWDTFCATLSSAYHGLPQGSFGHYLPDPADHGTAVQGSTSGQLSGEDAVHESFNKNVTPADIKSLMDKIKSIGIK